MKLEEWHWMNMNLVKGNPCAMEQFDDSSSSRLADVDD